MIFERFSKILRRQWSRLHCDNIQLRLFCIVSRRNEGKSGQVGTATDVHVKSKQPCNNEHQQACKNGVSQNDPFFGVRYEWIG
jgi:hypothetical protein